VSARMQNVTDATVWYTVFFLHDYNFVQGLNTFEYRPHCGEAGDSEHMAASFLVADKINHGILLRKASVQVELKVTA
jgi:adenosine deaminase